MKNRTQLITLATVIALLNLPLLFGHVNTSMTFTPQAFLSGSFWQLITFPFIHVSLYHLLMDAGAFLYLYHEMRHHQHRTRYTIAAAAGSLILSLLTSPLENGLCGLSGIAHGLLALCALDYMKQTDPFIRKAGLITLLIVSGKALLELLTGGMLFAFLHPGHIGNPVPACHAGGILGALLMHLFLQKEHPNSTTVSRPIDLPSSL